MTHELEFLSYSGHYPVLCIGEFAVKIDGEEYRFGNELYDDKGHIIAKNSKNLPPFWRSGGSCSLDGDKIEDIITRKPWKLSEYCIVYPEPIQECLDDLIDLFNKNVQFGCCGGCL